ncbi:MAG: ornithine carbamoyltransferase [Thermoguttaceae bacterium]|nr:ornithine carbamoyltransferase [Thermoguttaceae bacterium]
MKPLRHFLTLADVDVDELKTILKIAETVKARFKEGNRTEDSEILKSKVLGLIFEKMSLRTRVSFEAGMTHLGGGSMLLEERHIGLGVRESIPDVSRVLSSMVDCIAFRAKRHSTVVEFAKYSSAPVINALTDEAHPCQALADMLTIKEEFGSFEDVKIAWVGDSNNVAASLVEASAMLGCKIAVSSPKGYEFSQAEIDKLTAQRQPGFTLAQIEDPREAVRGARVVYTDVWVSMGQEKEEQERVAAFKPYQVNAELMGLARTDAIFLHCLPARRGLEVTDEVIDSSQSRVVEEAANRMHAQKGLLIWLLGN